MFFISSISNEQGILSWSKYYGKKFLAHLKESFFWTSVSPFVNKWENWTKWVQESFRYEVLFFPLKVDRLSLKKKNLLYVSSHYRSRDFLMHKISDCTIARSNKFVLRITEVISANLLPCHRVSSWFTLLWIRFWNLAIWKRRPADYPFPATVRKKKRFYQKVFAKWILVNQALLILS